MKKPEGIDDFLKMLLQDEDDTYPQQEIGVISKERIAESDQIEYDMEDVKDEIQRKMDDYLKKLKREYAPKMDDLEQRNKNFWKNVYQDIGSNGKGKHTLDRKTGVISRPIMGWNEK